jgi:hypothetical protein
MFSRSCRYNMRIYTLDTTGSQDYATVKAACAAQTFTGLSGRGYVISYNRCAIGQPCWCGSANRPRKRARWLGGDVLASLAWPALWTPP